MLGHERALPPTTSRGEDLLIGQRTKDALAVKKAAGVRLGRRPVPDAVRDRIVAARAEGRTLRSIADELNAENVPTGQGAKQWWAESVRGIAAAAVRNGDGALASAARAREAQRGEARSRRCQDIAATGAPR